MSNQNQSGLGVCILYTCELSCFKLHEQVLDEIATKSFLYGNFSTAALKSLFFLKKKIEHESLSIQTQYILFSLFNWCDFKWNFKN